MSITLTDAQLLEEVKRENKRLKKQLKVKGKLTHKNRSSADSTRHEEMLQKCMHKISASGLFPELRFYPKKHPEDFLKYRGINEDVDLGLFFGHEPDGGSVVFEKTPRKVEISFEAKYGGVKGQAHYALYYEKLYLLEKGLNPKAKTVIFATGPGADANPYGKNKTEKGKFETFYQGLKSLGANVKIYQKVDLFEEQEMMDRILEQLAELVGRPVETISAPIVKSKSSTKGIGVLDV
jgi:hypothetical protein